METVKWVLYCQLPVLHGQNQSCKFSPLPPTSLAIKLRISGEKKELLNLIVEIASLVFHRKQNEHVPGRKARAFLGGSFYPSQRFFTSSLTTARRMNIELQFAQNHVTLLHFHQNGQITEDAGTVYPGWENRKRLTEGYFYVAWE